MKVRQARNNDEVWLLDKLEELGIDDPGFRSRDYVIALTDDDTPCGAGRIRYRTTDDGADIAELDNLVSFGEHQGPPPLPEIVRGLANKVADEDIDRLYSPDPPDRLKTMDGRWETLALDGEGQDVFVLPVDEARDSTDEADQKEELADEFGYDEDTTTKYSID